MTGCEETILGSQEIKFMHGYVELPHNFESSIVQNPQLVASYWIQFYRGYQVLGMVLEFNHEV